MDTPPTGSMPDMDGEQRSSLALTPASSRAATRAQRLFQRLVARIELKRDDLRNWEAYLLRYNERIRSELEPLQAQLRADQQQMAALLDELLTRPAEDGQLNDMQRAKLRALLLDLLEGLLGEKPDSLLEAMHDRYSDVSHEQVRQSDMQRTLSFIEEVMGLHIDEDHGASTTEELLQYARRKVQERAAAEEAQAQEHGRPQPDAGHSGAASAKAQARQAQREQIGREAGQSLREVFRRLASALHPDREPEEQERERKTLLMQRVNQAYEARDLFTLLSLQMEIEQLGSLGLQIPSSERLTHYNHILREQLIELTLDLEHCLAPFRQRMDGFRERSMTIADVEHGLSATCAQLTVAINELQAEMTEFRDPERLRESLKRFELDPESDDGDDLAELVATYQPVPNRPRRS